MPTHLVIELIFLCSCGVPRFISCNLPGKEVNTDIRIDAEMYGNIPRENKLILVIGPPANNAASPELCLALSAKAFSTFSAGRGILQPTLYTTMATNVIIARFATLFNLKSIYLIVQQS